MVFNEIIENRILTGEQNGLLQAMLNFFTENGKEIQTNWSSVVLQRVLEIMQPQIKALEDSLKSFKASVDKALEDKGTESKNQNQTPNGGNEKVFDPLDRFQLSVVKSLKKV